MGSQFKDIGSLFTSQYKINTDPIYSPKNIPSLILDDSLVHVVVKAKMSVVFHQNLNLRYRWNDFSADVT